MNCMTTTHRSIAAGDRIANTCTNGKVEFGTVHSTANPNMGHYSLLVRFDDGTFCNLAASAVRKINN